MRFSVLRTGKTPVPAISISRLLYTTAAGLQIAVSAIVQALIFRNLLEKTGGGGYGTYEEHPCQYDDFCGTRRIRVMRIS